MDLIIARLTEFINALRNGDPESIVTMIGFFLVFVIALLLDRLINGGDDSNTCWRRHDDQR